MREIKFRAWDISNKVMLDNHEINGDWLISGKYNFFTPMQYTGLKDKNGKEIYEGDIVDAIAELDFKDQSIISDVIFGKDHQWQIRSCIDAEHGLPICWGGWESLEIIGNIYEHPQLLNP